MGKQRAQARAKDLSDAATSRAGADSGPELDAVDRPEAGDQAGPRSAGHEAFAAQADFALDGDAEGDSEPGFLDGLEFDPDQIHLTYVLLSELERIWQHGAPEDLRAD